MLAQIPGTRQVTGRGDKAYDTADFVAECRNLKVPPHVAKISGSQAEVPLMLARRSTSDVPSVRKRGSALRSASDG